MKIFPPEPKVKLYEEGFEDRDILQRAVVGKSLSNLVERIEDPMVVALDGGWGTGKTYFLKRWVGAHTLDNEGTAKTVYFDAFANDYLSDPLPALVSALSERFPKADENTLKRVKVAAFKLAKPFARIGLAMATFGATEALSPVGDAAVNALNDEASRALENYWSQEDGRRGAMEEFRSALTALVAIHPDADDDEVRDGARLVIVVDELDRCRPDYALEVLEVIKHFFSIPGVTFVLGANLLALENSVRARYGGSIDASAYLRKFINVSLSLPSEIGQQHDVKDAVLVYLQHQISEIDVPDHIATSLKPHVKLVARNNSISIRDIGKILSSVSLLSNDILQNKNILFGWVEVTVALLVSRVVRPELFSKFLNATVTAADLEEYFGATSNRISEEIGGEHNPDYDHATWMRFNLWMYLVQDGQLSNEPNVNVRDIGRQFDQFGAPRSPRTIPQNVYRKWLDLFAATSA